MSHKATCADRNKVIAKGKLIVSAAVLAISASGIAIAAIGLPERAANSVPLPPQVSGAPQFVAKFGQHDRRLWRVSHGWSNGDYAMNDWRRSQSRFDGNLKLVMDANKSPTHPFSSGEVQSKATYGHGYFEATMRAAKGSGLISGFFTYTGPPFGRPWNEIDVEILGAKPDEILLTYYYREGKVTHKHKADFDASKGFHTYGFDWQPGFIEWYIDGKPVFRATRDDLTLPNEPQKIMMSLLGSKTLNRWAGDFDVEAIPASVEFSCIAYTSSAKKSQPCWETQNASLVGASSNRP